MKRTMTLLAGVTAVGLLLVAVPVRAHHSFAAAFDETKPINLQGTVTKVELVNPHSWVWIDTHIWTWHGGANGHPREAHLQPRGANRAARP